MYCTVVSGAVYGIDSYLVTVEVDISNGLPGIDMVGSLSLEVKEAKERVKVALQNSGYTIPPCRITINLSPANIKKEGSGFDLPIAVGILKGMGRISESEKMKNSLFVGELGLNGEVRFAKGILPIVLEAKTRGIEYCFVPYSNRKEASVVTGMKVYGIKNIQELIGILEGREADLPDLESKAEHGLSKTRVEVNENGEAKREGEKEEKEEKQSAEKNEKLDFAQINGQEVLKRVALISAAGFHHVLIVGPPGVGKTMVAKRMTTILPPMSMDECLEVTKIYSVSGLIGEDKPLIVDRPFMNPHHTISKQALAGGGRIPKPGVISLAHKGVLFLDELPEFNRETLDVMRQPLEEKKIQISRNSGNFDYPSDFILFAALNPCPCGYYPNFSKCSCTEMQIKKYIGHISGPLLDRIDLSVRADEFDVKKLHGRGKEISSSEMKQKVILARERQLKRFDGQPYTFNSQLNGRELERYCMLKKDTRLFFEEVVEKKQLSARSYYRTLKVARTIADLDDSEEICKGHLLEAISYRDEKILG